MSEMVHGRSDYKATSQVQVAEPPKQCASQVQAQAPMQLESTRSNNQDGCKLGIKVLI